MGKLGVSAERRKSKTNMNRSEINRALAKALSYAECGKFEEAQRWGEVLIRKLELSGVFKVGDVKVEPFRCMEALRHDHDCRDIESNPYSDPCGD